MEHPTKVPLEKSILCMYVCVILVAPCFSASWNTSVTPLGVNRRPLLQSGKKQAMNSERMGKWGSVLCHSYITFFTPITNWAILTTPKRKPVLTLISFSSVSRSAEILKCFSNIHLGFFCCCYCCYCLVVGFVCIKNICKWSCLSKTIVF